MDRMQIFPQAAGGAGGGSVWYSGSGAPAGGTGVDGDYYLDTASGDVYTKVSGSWGSAIENLTGAIGATGAPGVDGSDGTIASRADIVKTTASLAPSAYETGYIDPFAKSFAIVKVTVGRAARVRLYSTAAQRDADVSRSAGVTPAMGQSHGVILDLVLDGTSGFPLSNFILSPEAYGANVDSPPVSRVYYNIQNLSVSSGTVTATFTTKIEEA